LQSIPDVNAVPMYVKPVLKKWNLDELEAQMPKYFSGRLPKTYEVWWNDFFKTTRQYLKVMPSLNITLLTSLYGKCITSTLVLSKRGFR
jgi:hypothetical protein